MSAIKLLIFDADKEYANNLSDFLVHNFSQYFNVCQCSSKSEIGLVIETFSPDIMIVSDDLYEYASSIFNKKIAVLSNGMHQNVGCASIYKYKNANNIAGDLMGLVDFNVCVDLDNNSDTSVIMFYSAAGGSGKTTLALLLAQAFANQAKKVFYLNLEGYQSTTLFLKGQSNSNFAQVLYYLKNGDINLASRVRALRSIDEGTNIYYFEPSKNIMDTSELDANDTKLLIKAIKDSDQYDFIIIDSSSTINTSCVTLLKQSNKVVLISTGTNICLHKTEAFLTFIDKIDNSESHEQTRNKIYLVCNKVDYKDEFLLKVKHISIAQIACVIPTIDDLESSLLHLGRFQKFHILSQYITELVGCMDYS